MEFYAHTLDGQPSDKWQKLEDHLKQTADLAGKFAESFGCYNWGYTAGLLHDLGKYSKEFQKYIRDSSDPDAHIEQKLQKIDHSSAGAQEIVKIYGSQVGRLLAYCISGHHGGLLNGSGSDSISLNDRLNKEVCKIFPDDKIMTLLPDLGNPPLELNNECIGFQLFLFVKMIYSCLVDADFLDTEEFMASEKSDVRSDYPDLLEISSRFWGEIERMQSNAENTSLNRIRNEIYQDCLKAAELESGLFSLTVPTGGGKTLSSMAFALKHAAMEKENKKRIIYVIPYTSIIEQNADVFRRFLGEDVVLEHHSNFEPKEEDYKTRLACENWDAPVIVTTNVQFYESFFANKSSRCRKLHNIANSVIIFDEVQSIPTDYLYPCLELIRELPRNYKCSIVLCTATQPAIGYRDTENDKFEKGLKNVREIVSDPHLLAEKLKRVKTQNIPETSNVDIANRISEHNKVLCIVNTKRHARELYELIGQSSNNYHLSTNMCPAHRREKFAEIRQKLKDEKECRVISTQLIEAGVDIDFPVVFRAMSGLDSIAQAAGRCNREGRHESGQVYIFDPEEIKLMGHLAQTAQEARQLIYGLEGEILTLDNIEEYFKNLFWVKGDDELDRHSINNDIRAGVMKVNFPFKDISGKFNIIANNTTPVIIPYDENAETIINSIDHIEFPGSLIRKLQKYTINLFPYQLQTLQDAGGLMAKNGGMFLILSRKDLYNDDFGLDLDNTYVNPEDLIA